MNPPVCGGPPENLTEEEKVEVDKYNKDLHEWTTNQAIVWQQIASMVPDLVFLRRRQLKKPGIFSNVTMRRDPECSWLI